MALQERVESLVTPNLINDLVEEPPEVSRETLLHRTDTADVHHVGQRTQTVPALQRDLALVPGPSVVHDGSAPRRQVLAVQGRVEPLGLHEAEGRSDVSQALERFRGLAPAVLRCEWPLHLGEAVPGLPLIEELKKSARGIRHRSHARSVSATPRHRTRPNHHTPHALADRRHTTRRSQDMGTTTKQRFFTPEQAAEQQPDAVFTAPQVEELQRLLATASDTPDAEATAAEKPDEAEIEPNPVPRLDSAALERLRQQLT